MVCQGYLLVTIRCQLIWAIHLKSGLKLPLSNQNECQQSLCKTMVLDFIGFNSSLFLVLRACSRNAKIHGSYHTFWQNLLRNWNPMSSANSLPCLFATKAAPSMCENATSTTDQPCDSSWQQPRLVLGNWHHETLTHHWCLLLWVFDCCYCLLAIVGLVLLVFVSLLLFLA